MHSSWIFSRETKFYHDSQVRFSSFHHQVQFTTIAEIFKIPKDTSRMNEVLFQILLQNVENRCEKHLALSAEA